MSEELLFVGFLFTIERGRLDKTGLEGEEVFTLMVDGTTIRF